jgi:hypothetical protein
MDSDTHMPDMTSSAAVGASRDREEARELAYVTPCPQLPLHMSGKLAEIDTLLGSAKWLLMLAYVACGP